MTDTHPTVVILTALPVEYTAVRRHLTGTIEERVHESGTRVECGRVSDAPWTIALAEIGEGTQNAAALTERLTAWLAPRAVLFVGIAGGLTDDLRLGDVVVATRVYAHQGGKQSPDGFHARPRAWDASHRLGQTARAALRGGEWSALVHFKPVTSGDVVLNSSVSTLSEQLKHHYNDAVAIEMESSGMALAAHLNGAVETLTIRGISDRADGQKHLADAGGSQPRAAERAAAAAMAVLRKQEPFGGGAAPAGQPATRHGGDHIDFSGGTFHGPVTGKVVNGPRDEG
ncbi:5'-methylthioadenosine/S-adenosylhomocysteine nucleosidase [Streptomyces sp. E11-3]|uniref:5'-methylthioadenosine/S-adenosylhomocysteine nucleosidase family protein n=1 Tax=Streptomyces sp. E11-3 TaxID=3110112 RepID=UPI0039818BD2